MQITILRETLPGEARVALLPEFIKKLTAFKVEVAVESGAGNAAFAVDSDYSNAGAKISANRAELVASTDMLLAINRPPANDFAGLKRGSVIIGFLKPLAEPGAL